MLATRGARPQPTAVRPEVAGSLRYLNDETLRALFAFPRDLTESPGVRINRLDDQVVVKYYTE